LGFTGHIGKKRERKMLNKMAAIPKELKESELIMALRTSVIAFIIHKKLGRR
jgi:hypothetical protein